MVFMGREHELKTLQDQADRDGFHMIVVYGRRRIGKTALIRESCKNRRTLSFTAAESSNLVNLRNFSNAIHHAFNEPETFGTFPDWDAAFSYIITKLQQEPTQSLTIVFDEFPYAAEACPSLPSMLQIAIDHGFLQTNATMILCGSNESFMEGRVLGYKSPLYGRRTAQIHLQPMNIFEASALMPANISAEERMHYYATLGGTPYYLNQIDPALTFSDNIRQLCFQVGGILYEEPMMLLRQELREPSIYFAVLNAVASGRTTPKAMAESIGIAVTSMPKYLKTLESIGLITRSVPFGEKPWKSKKGQWRIKDPFFAYWFQFVAPATAMIENNAAEQVATNATTGNVFSTYVGAQFESACEQWLLRRAELPFVPLRFGKWWGTDPQTKEQTDIDIVMDNEPEKRLLLGECKWRNHVNETETIRTLKNRKRLIQGDYQDCQYYLFTKKPVSEGTRKKTEEDPTLHVVDSETMFVG